MTVVPKGDPKTGQFLLKLPPEMLDDVKRLASEETRSATGQIVQLLKEALAARKEKKGGG